MTDSPPPRFVGIQPRFPWFLGRWVWLNAVVPAERMAALRIAVALSLLLDLGLGCLPYFTSLYTADGLAGRDAYPWRFREGHYYWSLLRMLPDSWGPQALMAFWIIAAIALAIGYRPFISGLLCWMCAVSFWNINPWVCNGGDQLRNGLLLTVAVSRAGAVWGVQSVRRGGQPGPVFVPGWPMKVLILQFTCLYFFSGVYKLISPPWQTGYVMFFVNHNLAWALAPNVTALLPMSLHRLSSWITLVWELGIPVLIAIRRTRKPTLWLGVVFHVLTLFTLEVGHFALYSLAWFVVWVPWERRQTIF